MSTSRVNEVMTQLRRATLRADAANLSDGRLLECFVACRDQAAFEALVRRHGAMVFGVCRRILRHHQDAEDAFQATFLVLARKAGSVRAATMANWLYGVAYQVAVKARALAGRQRARERQVSDMPERESTPEAQWTELEPLLDEELSRLPDRYRLPVVLCDLEGKKLKEAAQQLGWRPGTLAGRLFRARQLLAKRLARHGPLLPAGLLATTLTLNAAAAVPAPLLVSTVKAASLCAAGPAASAGLVSGTVAALTKGALQRMLLIKLRIASAVMLTVAGMVFLASAAWYATPAAPPGGAPAVPPPPAVVAPPDIVPPKVIVPQPFAVPVNAKTVQLPSGIAPQQALVCLSKDGHLEVTMPMSHAIPFTNVLPDGKTVTTYQVWSKPTTSLYKIADIKVQDVKGKAIDNKELAKLKDDTLVLVFPPGQTLDPLHLRLTKEDTMILIIPGLSVQPVVNELFPAPGGGAGPQAVPPQPGNGGGMPPLAPSGAGAVPPSQ